MVFKFSAFSNRLQKQILTSLSMLITKSMSSILIVVLTPLLVEKLGKEAYGVYAAFFGFMFFANSDFGLGLTLQNQLPYSDEKNFEKQKLISSTFFFLLFVSTIFLVSFFCTSPFFNWNKIFNTSVPENILNAAALIFFVGLFVSIPLSITQKIRNAFQLGYYNEIFISLGSFFSICLISLLYFLDRLTLITTMWATFGMSTFFVGIGFVIFFKDENNRNFWPRANLFDLTILKESLKKGLLFFMMSLFAQLLSSFDTLLIANQFGASQATGFSIAYRLVSLLSLPVLLYTNPFLPAINDAFSKGDVLWVKNMISKSIKVIFFYGVIVATIVYFGGNMIIEFWMHDKSLFLKPFELLSISIFLFVLIFTHFFSIIMLLPVFIKFTFNIYIFSSIIVLIFKLYFIQRTGIYGVLWGSIIALPILFFLPSYIKIKSAFRFLNG